MVFQGDFYDAASCCSENPFKVDGSLFGMQALSSSSLTLLHAVLYLILIKIG